MRLKHNGRRVKVVTGIIKKSLGGSISHLGNISVLKKELMDMHLTPKPKPKKRIHF